MKVFYTEQALKSLDEALSLIEGKASSITIFTITNTIFNRCEKLTKNPKIGRKEDYLEHLGLGHRRIIQGNYKIIYRIEGKIIYITDIFDARQRHEKMKG